MSKRVARIRKPHPMRITAHGALSGPKKNSFSRAIAVLELLENMFGFGAEISSSGRGFVARQNIAVTEINSPVNGLGRIDVVEPDQILEIVTQGGTVSI